MTRQPMVLGLCCPTFSQMVSKGQSPMRRVPSPRVKVVLEPDPQKIEKEGLVNRLGWKCTLRNVRNFINC